ncbi:MAG: DUF1203 domain-containing protein [Gammaproteobacteria bacterium]
MTFQIHALDPSPFEALSQLEPRELHRRRAVWIEADSAPGYPCRVTLEDARVGTRLLLFNFEHQPVNTPFRSSHAIYVNPLAKQALLQPGTVPPSFTSRLISWRAFGNDGMMVDADAVDGSQLKAVLTRAFEQEYVAYIHLHYAGAGCYAARVTRASNQ